MTAVLPTALFSPPSTNKPTPLTPILNADETTKLKTLEGHFGALGYVLPVKEHAEEKAALTDREMMFLSRETFLRFLKGSKGDVHAAITRLEACLVWRRTEHVDDVQRMAKECEGPAKYGKNMVMGFSTRNQPIIYFFTNRDGTPLDQRRAVHGVYMIERAYDLMPAGVSNILIVFNFSGKRQGPPTSISVARETIHILSAYYPETLGVSIFQNMPWVAKTFVNLFWPFVDPVTKQKVKFGSAEGGEIIKDGDVEAAQLLKDGGGLLDWSYNHDQYWPTLAETCLRIRAEEDKRWRNLGERKVGRETRLFKRHFPLESIDANSDSAANAGKPINETSGRDASAEANSDDVD